MPSNTELTEQQEIERPDTMTIRSIRLPYALDLQLENRAREMGRTVSDLLRQVILTAMLGPKR